MLRNDRHYGDSGSIGRIYFTALDSYAQRYGISGVAFDVFLQLVLAMDHEYLDWENARQVAEREKMKREER